MAKAKVSHLQETQKSDQPSTIANRKFLNCVAKAKAAVEKYEEDRDKELTTVTFTGEEFEEFGLLMQSVRDISNSLEQHLDPYENGGGLNHCLGMVAHRLDNLFCEVQERAEKGGAA